MFLQHATFLVRRAIIVIFLLLQLSHSHAKKGHSKHQTSPNILLILADDLGYNDVPWHNPTVQAPHLLHLAKTGLILEQNYVQPKCAPSRAALLTGRYPYRMGRQHESLPPSMPTGLGLQYPLLSSSLQDLGYSTHAVGKWHLGYCAWDYTPTRRGFDTFFGFYTHGEDYYQRIVTDSRKLFRGYDLRDNETVTEEGEGEYSAHLFSRKAVETIQSAGEKPLFLYLSFQSIHKPIQVPDNYARLYQPYGRLTKDSRRLGMISALDEAVKNVTRALKESGRYQNTAILFMSDNGGAVRGSNWPLRGGKNSVWEGGTRSPAFLHFPGIKRKYRRRVSSELIHAVDWVPTILAMSGHPNYQQSQQSEGLSQWLALSGNMPGPRSELIYNINDALRFTAAIRSGKWKFIWGYPDGLKSNVPRKQTRQQYAQTMYEATKSNLLYLFNLEEDPNETVNLAQTERKVMKRLMKKLRKIIRSGEVVKPDTPFLRERSLPVHWNGTVSPGWCRAKHG